MKKISFVLAIAVLALAIFQVSCKKDENEAPEFVKIEYSSSDTSATLTFSEAVYANNDGTGNLDFSNFSLLISSPEPDTISLYIIHLSGSTTAKFDFEITTPIDGNEIITINPESGSSIYDSEGLAMESNQEVSFIMEK